MVGAAIAHDVEAQRAVRQLRRDIDGPAHRGQGIEIVGEGFPVEFHALVQHRAGNVLDTFHQVDQVGRLARPHRREADAAIAEHRGGDAMPGRGRHERVPGRLAVIVRMNIDEARLTIRPAASISRRPLPSLGPTAVILPSCTATSATRRASPSRRKRFRFG